jgi:serine/threonine protein kinase
MGEVYRARDTRLAREVAIKVLPEAFARDADRLQRFEHEARVLSTVNHPNILAIHAAGAQGDLHYLVSELLKGQTLREKMNAGPLSQRRVTEYAVEMAHGLAAAHDKGIVHRDLKPDNIFITKDGRVKILDFGLAKQTIGEAGLSDKARPWPHLRPPNRVR